LRHRVIVTGVGAITPVGTGPAFWESLCAGRSGIAEIKAFDVSDYDCRIAGEVTDFDPLDYLDRRESRRMDRFCQLALAAASLALADAGMDRQGIPGGRTGVLLGTGIGGIHTLLEQQGVLQERGPGRVSPLFIPMMIANMAAGQLAIALGAQGPNSTTVTACASATNAIGDAFRLIRRGDADMMFTGGTEAPIVPLALAGFCSMKALSTRNDEPARASRPFDRERDGFVMGEGAGVLVLESLEHARARDARIYGEISGYGMTADAHHITAPAPGGDGGARAMQAALADAGLRPEDIDYINAHGTSTPANDKAETEAIQRVFGERAGRLAVSATKSMTGHLLGAAGAIELIATLLTLRHGIIPPTINYEHPDPECDLDYVPNECRHAPVRVALSNSFGFGGQNACLVVHRCED